MKKEEMELARVASLAPEIYIDRVLFDSDTGKLTALDVHNETDGCAYFLEVKSSHFHGYKKKK